MPKKSLTDSHEFPIPRMNFEFNPEGVGEYSEFTLDIPMTDIDTAIRYRPELRYLPEPEGRLGEIVRGAGEENIGGRLTVTEGDETVRVDFGFSPLPPRAEVRRGGTAVFNPARFNDAMLPQHEHIAGRFRIFKALAAITTAQYQFAVPPDQYKPEYPVPGARFSFVDGVDLSTPRVVVTHQFNSTLHSLKPEQSMAIKSDILDYYAGFDPANDTRILQTMTVPGYGRIFSAGHFSYGQSRMEFLSEADIASDDQYRDSRLQPGDAYYALGHNTGDFPHAKMVAMVAVGSINRICRERQEQLAAA